MKWETYLVGILALAVVWLARYGLLLRFATPADEP